MSSKLVIVESPTKARTITRFLGNGVQVMASQGHVRDLPEHTMGVDIENNFKPDYELTANGRKIVSQLKQAAKGASDIYLATDPDREGEAIAWHLQEVLRNGSKASFHRITFHEITKNAIMNSFAAPGALNINMVNAQQARRILDRIVGYRVSPFLWKDIKGASSAGRVQTVALRLVVEREREIDAFVPVESWNIDAIFNTQNPKSSFKARLAKVNGHASKVSNGDDAAVIADAISAKDTVHRVAKVTSVPRTKNAPPPFITSTLQQAAGSNLGFGASQTMRVAQELYEGIDLGSGEVGLITYMRTDSFNISKEAQNQARSYIAAKFGPEYVPAKPNVFRAGKNAQEAHEAIRPTDMQYEPERIKSRLTPQQFKLYSLIWNRFLASQMAQARQMDHVIEVESVGNALKSIAVAPYLAKNEKEADASTNAIASSCIENCTFRASSRETTFLGFMMAYKFKELGEEDEDNIPSTLPVLQNGVACALAELSKEQCFSQPPPHYSEASLVKTLEQNGVGRPSTYATTVNTIQERKYVSKTSGALKPTKLGCDVCDYLTGKIQTLFEVKFTARMEDELDQIEEGKIQWEFMLHGFYDSFQKWIGSIPTNDNSAKASAINQLLACFSDDFKYAEPITVGRRKYDDKKFVESIRQRQQENAAITERQWNALLTTAVKYAGEHPEINTVLENNGLHDQVQDIRSSLKKHDDVELVPPTPESLELLKAVSKLEFEAPETKARHKGRSFDNGKFVKSLSSQVKTGKALSDAQLRVLVRIASDKSAEIPDFEKLVAPYTDMLPQRKNDAPKAEASATAKPVAGQDVKILVDMIAEVTAWKPGRGRFDDKTFVNSVARQFAQRGSLTEKQCSALYKVLSKYTDQIANFEARTVSFKPEK